MGSGSENTGSTATGSTKMMNDRKLQIAIDEFLYSYVSKQSVYVILYLANRSNSADIF